MSLENVEKFDEYMDFTLDVAIYPGAGSGSVRELSYLSLGLNGEAGEVAEYVKKVIRDQRIGVDDSPPICGEHMNKIEKELGDVLWYLARLCDAFGFQMSEVATTNRIKLTRRKKENQLHGSGSDR